MTDDLRLSYGGLLELAQVPIGEHYGDEVNEAARIEACATGGRALASKALIERLNPADAADLDVDPDRIIYAALGQLDTATDKARRDAPAIAVCDV